MSRKGRWEEARVRHRSGPKLIVLGRQEAEEYLPAPSEVCISIRGVGESKPDLKYEWRNVLYLVFHDHLSGETPFERIEYMTVEQAMDVIQYVESHLDKSAIVIHCGAGVSRSRTLAGMLAYFFRFPQRYTLHNENVSCAMMRAWKKHRRLE